MLLVTSPKLPSLPVLDIETSRGKRTTQLDLTQPLTPSRPLPIPPNTTTTHPPSPLQPLPSRSEITDSDKLRNLIKDCDVFLQSYRPGSLEKKGFGPDDVAKLRPGVVYASLTAYQRGGQLSHMRGVSNISVEERCFIVPRKYLIWIIHTSTTPSFKQSAA